MSVAGDYIGMSQDGQTWDILRDMAFSSPVPVTVGLMSQSPLGAPLPARFSDIHFEAKPSKLLAVRVGVYRSPEKVVVAVAQPFNFVSPMRAIAGKG